MRVTWYVLQSGAPADPAEVVHGDDGVLRHVSGVAVAVGPHGPRSRSMGADEIAAMTEPKAAKPSADRQMKPNKTGAKYETR